MTYTEEELKQVPGEFTPSPFVKRSQVWTMSVREVQSLPVEMAGCCRENRRKWCDHSSGCQRMEDTF